MPDENTVLTSNQLAKALDSLDMTFNIDTSSLGDSSINYAFSP